LALIGWCNEKTKLSKDVVRIFALCLVYESDLSTSPLGNNTGKCEQRPYQPEQINIALTLYVQMAPPRWTTAKELLWLQTEVPTYLQMRKEKKLNRFFELLYPKWFSNFPEHMRVFPSENSPNEATNINQSDLDLEEAINEVDTELDHENSISDVEKLTKLDTEQTKVLNDTINHRRKVCFLMLSYI
jgi:hypothetical protein